MAIDDDFPELATLLRETCSNGSEIGQRAMARNILCDLHRTAPERMRAFLADAGKLLNIQDVQKALLNYRWAHVCPPKARRGKTQIQPVYARAENLTNAITADALPTDATVATVLNLTWLGEIYAAARSDFKMPEFERFELANPKDPAEVNAKLGDALSDNKNREPFLAAILKARNKFNHSKLQKYIRITWVAEWNSLEKFLTPADPQRWMQAVGVTTETPVWAAVLRYPLRRARKSISLYRPTQLDACWYPHHFPSPPQAHLPDGGYSMFLGLNGGTYKGYGLVRDELARLKRIPC